jgi:hypothetical protein
MKLYHRGSAFDEDVLVLIVEHGQRALPGRRMGTISACRIT